MIYTVKVVRKIKVCDKIMNIITGAASIATCVSVVIATLNIILSNKKARREQTVMLILDWSKNLDKRSSLARKYVEKLSQRQIESLVKEEKIFFNSSDKYERELYFKIKKLLIEDENNYEKFHVKIYNTKYKLFYLTEEESSKLRWIVMCYLNKLESMMVAWEHKGAVRKIINQQFLYLVNSTDDGTLHKFRKALNEGKAFPSIDKFIQSNKKKKC